MRFLAVVASLLLILGCQDSVLPSSSQSAESAPPADQSDLFGPARMRLHPIFTKIESLSGGTKPDGIEAVLEFDDRFGDTTKAAGAVIFELYQFRNGYPDPRGERLTDPWTASLTGVEQQKAHWRREIGAYSFLLAYDAIRAGRNYVLTATFEPLSGPRLFATTIITSQNNASGSSTRPAAMEITPAVIRRENVGE